jgi:hypothetical protein
LEEAEPSLSLEVPPALFLEDCGVPGHVQRLERLGRQARLDELVVLVASVVVFVAAVDVSGQ